MLFKSNATIVVMTTGEVPKIMTTSDGNWPKALDDWVIPIPKATDNPTTEELR